MDTAFDHNMMNIAEPGDEDIFPLARRLNLNEYEFFYTAGSRWGITLERVQEDFQQYLWLSELPFYVLDWVRALKATPPGAYNA